MILSEVAKNFVQEVGVFEIRKQTEIQNQTENEPALFLPLRIGVVNKIGEGVINHRRKYEQQKINAAAFVIEVKRKQNNIDQFRVALFAQQVKAANEKQEHPQE